MKKKNENTVWETITVRMTQEEKETLRKIAEEEDLTLTIYVKRLLRREIRKAQEPTGMLVGTVDGKKTWVPLNPHPDSSGGVP